MSNVDDAVELNHLLEKSPPLPRLSKKDQAALAPKPDAPPEAIINQTKFSQWTSSDGKRYLGAARSIEKLPPGLYDINMDPTVGLFFDRLKISSEGLLRFPHTNSEKIVQEIQKFWTREERFKEFKLPHKRGILLYGPPGSGKTCTTRLIMHDVIDRGGICIRYGHPVLFLLGMRVLRDVQPETPAVVLMEDLDATIAQNDESIVLNTLDGSEAVEHTVFLATTNYPERLGSRIVNRPSRFDKRFKIGHPDAKARGIYFDSLIGRKRISELKIDIKTWIKDTEKMSLAHLKELFVAVVILGDDYKEAVETLRSMQEIAPVGDRDTTQMGYMGGN